MDVRAFVIAVGRHWRVAVAGLLIGILGGLGVLLTSETIYKSSAQLFLTTPGWGGPTTLGNADSSAYQGDEFSQQRAQTYVRLAQGGDFAARVSERLGGEVDTATVEKHLDARVVPDTVLVEITAGNGSAVVARDIAVAAAAELTANITALEVPSGTTIATVQPVAVGTPVVASTPSEPRPLLTMALAITLGALLGVTGVVLRVRSVRTVDDAESAAALVAAPVLGTVPAPGHSTLNARFDELRYNLEYLGPRFSGGLIVVTSARQGEGRTSTVAGLAAAYARAGRSVLMIDADLRGGSIGSHPMGLSNVVAGDVGVDRAIVTSAGVSVMGSGVLPNEPTRMLESPRLMQVLKMATEEFDVVLLDTPDLERFDDARLLTRSADIVLMVVAAGVPTTTLRDATDALRVVGVTPAGVVLTNAARTTSRFGYLATVTTDAEDADTPDTNTTVASRQTETVASRQTETVASRQTETVTR